MSQKVPSVEQSGSDAGPSGRRGDRSPAVDSRSTGQSPHDELRRAQEINRRLLQAMPCGVVQVDADGTVRSANAEAQRILRMNLDELNGRHVSTWEPVTIREDGSRVSVDEYPESICMRTGQPAGPVTIGIRFNDGTVTWALYSAAPLLDPTTSAVTGAVVTFQDITASRHSQSQLREVEERYRQLVEFNPDAIFVHDGERFMYANAEAIRLYGAKSQEDLLGRRILDLVLPEDREFVSNRIRNLMSSQWQVSPRRQTRILRIDGEVADVEAVGTRVQFDGKPAIQVVLHDVSDREQADRALREERERLMTVITSAPIVLWVTDTQGVTRISEGRALEKLGLRSGEVVGRNVFDMYADHAGITSAHRRALQGESVLETVEVQGLVFESRIMPLRDAAGKITGVLGVATDITDRRRAEQSHKQSEARLSAIIANTPTVAIEGYDINGRVLFWNEAAQKMFGWSESEAVGRTLDELMLSPVAARDFEALLKEVQRSGQPMPREWAYRNRQGERGVCYSTVFAVPGTSADEPANFICMDIDITQRKQAEESLHQSEERLRSIFQAAIDPLWDWDVVTDRTLHSPSWAKMLGYEPHELDESMHEWEKRVHSDDRPRVWEALRACLDGKAPDYEAVYRLRVKSGEWLWALSRGRVVERDSRGKALRMVGSITDITERKKAEENLRNASNLQRLLLSELDHRVRNNLASLSALIDISARAQTNVHELARSIQGRVQAMATVHGLLSRGHFRTVWLESLIGAIVPEDLHARVDVSGPEVLLPPRQVTAMGMVIQELTANSLKYGALSTIEGRVTVKWTSRQSRDERHFVVELDWHERGGKPIAPSGAGEPRVGTALIQGLVRAELRGEAVLSYPEHGATHRFIILIERPETTAPL